MSARARRRTSASMLPISSASAGDTSHRCASSRSTSRQNVTAFPSPSSYWYQTSRSTIGMPRSSPTSRQSLCMLEVGDEPTSQWMQ